MPGLNGIGSVRGEGPGFLQVVAGAQRATAETEGFWEGVLDSVPANVAVLDRDGLIVAVNAPWREFARRNGARVAVDAGSDYLAVCDRAAAAGDPAAAEAAGLLRRTLSGFGGGGKVEYECDGPGVRRRCVMRVVPHRVEGRLEGAVALHFDITEHAAAVEQLRVQARLLNQVDAAVVALDANRVVTFWSDGAERLYGWSSEEIEGRVVNELMEPWPGAFSERLQTLLEEEAAEGVIEVRCKDGSVIPVQMRNTLIRAGDGSVEALLGVSTDARQRVRDDQVARSARDYLRAVTESIPEGLFTIDGDGSLIELNAEAERLLGWSVDDLRGRRMHDVIHGCRLAYEDCPVTNARVEGRTIQVDEDVFVQKDGALLDVAYKASPFETPDGFNGTVVVFRDISHEKAKRLRQQRELLELSWAARIRDALDRDGFELYAQPIVDILTGETVQHELLLRMSWNGEVVSPGEFLPAAERHGLMEEIDRWVVGRAVELSRLGVPVELNISAQSLGRPAFHDFIEEKLSSPGVDPSLVAIEVTETSLVENENTAAQLLKRLAQLGCDIALDDFGTGYGGFSYLKRLPVDFLKIDREFVTELTSDPSNRAVVSAVVNLARAFGQKTVAEGVEDAETLQMLAVMGVEYAQGYLLGRPRPATDVLTAQGAAGASRESSE
jgi:PAS domain S-box-containing protein